MKSAFGKALSLALAVILVATCAVSCRRKKIEDTSSYEAVSVRIKEDINIAALKGPTALGMLKLMSDAKNDINYNNYKIETYTSPDQIAPLIINKSVDIAAVPTNLAASLYQKTDKNIKIIAVNTLGVLSILTNGVKISSVADLKGKTIFATGKGSTPEYALNYVLEKNGLKVGQDVFVEYKSDHSELAALMASGEVKIGMLPQPFVASVTMKNKSVSVALDISDEWEKIPDTNGAKLAMGCLIVRKDYLDNHKKDVDYFLSEYSASTLQANDKLPETAALSESFGIMSAEVTAAALDGCNIVYIDGAEMKKSVSEYLNVLFAANGASVGNALPDDEFYYEK